MVAPHGPVRRERIGEEPRVERVELELLHVASVRDPGDRPLATPTVPAAAR
jgi:hypothetical protein